MGNRYLRKENEHSGNQSSLSKSWGFSTDLFVSLAQVRDQGSVWLRQRLAKVCPLPMPLLLQALLWVPALLLLEGSDRCSWRVLMGLEERNDLLRAGNRVAGCPALFGQSLWLEGAMVIILEM